MECMQLIELPTRRVVLPRLLVADTLWHRGIGLLGQRNLNGDTGLWIEPCNGIHTFLMRFPIDVLFLDAKGVALRVVEALPPNRICGFVRGARVVVEMAAGTAVQQELRAGTRYARTVIEG